MTENNSRTKPLKSIEEWNKAMFPHMDIDKVFNDDNASPEAIASKWAERAIDMLPNKPMKPVC